MGNKIQRIAAPPQDSQPSLPNHPDEMLTEILLRLPVKSLLRFRCVSKSWLFLISSNDFAKAHLKVSAKNNVYIHDKLIFGSRNFPFDLYTCSLHSLVEDYGHAKTDFIYHTNLENVKFDRVCFDSPFPEKVHKIELVGSCNGLVCVYMCLKFVILWNPTTRKSRMLPGSGTDLDLHNEFNSHVTYGFGYDELHDDYNVVESLCFGLHQTREREFQVKVYSMRTNSWKTLLNWPGGYPFVGSSIFLNGAIHWLLRKLSHGSIDSRTLAAHWGIVSYNLATETFLKIPMPNFDDDDNVIFEINVLGGCLALYCSRHFCLDVFVMKEYGVKEYWTKLVCIPFFMDHWNTPYLSPKPLFFSMDGKIVMNFGSSLRIYDSRHPHDRFDLDMEVEATTYIESLISLDLDVIIKQ